MEHYRIYPIGVDGAIVQGHSVECDTDDEAIQLAAEHISPHPVIEIWCGTRRVCRMTAAQIARYRRA